ncbi:hypothetical protein ACFO25_09120 [Paenactinomyces guangxiensis]|uniref:hypothetical protein n=1 Tax=Paenactinomyces guangxiensis TaxID=1490290 RepID=UPI001E52CFA0|nr:hypothetical protein [Paenactinomyces guangxiensis]
MQETLRRAKEIAAALAKQAGEMAKAQFDRDKRVMFKSEFDDLVTEVESKQKS